MITDQRLQKKITNTWRSCFRILSCLVIAMVVEWFLKQMTLTIVMTSQS